MDGLLHGKTIDTTTGSVGMPLCPHALKLLNSIENDMYYI